MSLLWMFLAGLMHLAMIMVGMVVLLMVFMALGTMTTNAMRRKLRETERED